MCADKVNTTGLILDMIGVVILLLNPLPYKLVSGGVISEPGTDYGDVEGKEKRNRLGWILIFIGFGLQVWAVWI